MPEITFWHTPHNQIRGAALLARISYAAYHGLSPYSSAALEREAPVRTELISTFLALAETLNFTKAAEQLHMTQPALSKQIGALEHEVGCPLISRGPGVSLTPAGQAFASDAFKAIEAIDRALDSARRAAKAPEPVRLHNYLANSRRSMGALRSIGDIPYCIVDVPRTVGSIDAVASGKVDVGTYLRPVILPCAQEVFDQNAIETIRLGSSPFSICMRDDNPLAEPARNGQLGRRDLERVPIIVFSPTHNSELIDMVRYMLGDDLNLQFRYRPMMNGADVYLADLEDGIHICGHDVNQRHLLYRDDVVIADRLIDAELAAPSWLIFCRNNPNHLVRPFAERFAAAKRES